MSLWTEDLGLSQIGVKPTFCQMPMSKYFQDLKLVVAMSISMKVAHVGIPSTSFKSTTELMAKRKYLCSPYFPYQSGREMRDWVVK